MQTFLVTNGSKTLRDAWITNELQKLHISTFDTRSIDKEEEETSIGIQRIKLFEKSLQLAPTNGKYSAGIIQNAHLLTIDAQNALLKTLEEPPSHAYIYIEAPTPSLLPTILSRATAIVLQEKDTSLSKEQKETLLQTLRLFLDSTISYGDKMAAIDTLISSNKEAKEWLEQAIIVFEEHKDTFSKESFLSLGKKLLKAQEMLSSNVTYKLVLDHLFLP